MKRGQITIFIIVAVLILIAIILFIILKQRILIPDSKVNPEVEPIYSFIQQCIDETAKESIIFISKNGGYFENPEKTFENSIPYYLYESENLMPSKEKIQEQLALRFNDNIKYCINNFKDFQEFEFQENKIKTTTQINDKEIIFNIDYPLTISKSEQTYQLEDFKTTISARLGIIHNAIFQIMQEQIQHSSSINPNYIYEVSSENDIQIKMIGFIEQDVIFTITDKNSKINNQDLLFIFANKYLTEDLI